MGDVALPRERHAQRAVDEEFQGRIHLLVDGADFGQVQLAGEDQLGEPRAVEKLRPFQGADVGLGTGVDLDGRQVQFHDAHVLHDQGIDADLMQLVDQRARRFQLIVMQDGIERDEHPHMEQMRERHQSRDIRHAVLGIVPCTEAGPADVHGIGAMQDGLLGNGDIPCRAQQFEVVLG